MKNKTLMLILLCVICTICISLCGCDLIGQFIGIAIDPPKPDPNTHVHRVGDYETDETYHWYTCKSCFEQLEKTEHDFSQVKYDQTEEKWLKVCSVCGYSCEHDHIKGEKIYKTDAEHYYLCELCDAQMDKEEHNLQLDYSSGGFDYYKCSVCGYTTTSTHTHEQEWQTTSTTHKAVCPLCYEVTTAETPHTFVDGYDADTNEEIVYCSVCGYVSQRTAHSICNYNADAWHVTDDEHSNVCTVCGKTFVQAHQYETKVDTTGSPYKQCKICGYISTQGIETEHIYIDLGITIGKPSSKTYTLQLPDDIGNIMGVYCDGNKISMSTTLNLSMFGLSYGEKIIKVVTTKYTINIPVTLVTKTISNAEQLNTFMSWADRYGSATGDYAYDGYYLLTDDIDLSDGYTLPKISSAKYAEATGFVGVFDGNGHTIDNLALCDVSTDYSAFITKLGANGVIKDVAFTNALLGGNSSFVTYGGTGTIQNVYVQYALIGANGSHVGSRNSITANSTTFGSDTNSKLAINNCVIDLTKEAFYAPKTADGSINVGVGSGEIISRFHSQEKSISQVFVVGANDKMNILYVWGHDERTSVSRRDSYLGGNFHTYATASDFVTYQGDAVGNWGGFWSFDGANIKFNSKTMLTANKGSLPSGDTFISSDKKSTDYVIVYDNAVTATQDAAAFIAKHVKRATGNVTYGAEKTTSLSNAYIDYDRVQGGIAMQTISHANWDANACMIVIGNAKLAQQAGVAMPTNHEYVIKQVGKSVFLLADDPCDYLAIALEFMEKALGYKALGNDLVTYGTLAQKLSFQTVEDALPFDLRNESAAFDWYNNSELGYNGSTFLSAPEMTWHNTFVWVNPDEYKATHPSWYSLAGRDSTGKITETDAYGNLLKDGAQLCYTAHGNQSELNAMVAVVAEKFVDYLLANPSVKNISFTQQDTRNWCMCDACRRAYTYYGNSNCGTVVDFLNKVVKYMDDNFASQLADRQYRIYFFAYHPTEMAPTGIKADSRVNVILAPIEACYYKSVYDTANDKFRNNMLKWADICDHMGVWLYEMVYSAYWMPYDSFESTLTWFEFCSHYLDVEWIFSEGVMGNKYSTNFATFKAYCDSHAEREIAKYVKPHDSYTSEAAYNTAIKGYLTKLEDEYFAVDGFYGKAGPKMRQLYNLERADCQNAIAESKKRADCGGDAFYDLTFTTTALAGKGATDGWISSQYAVFYTTNSQMCFRFWTKNQISAYMTALDGAFDALDRNDPLYYLHYRHVLQESIGPRYMACNSRINVTQLKCRYNDYNTGKVAGYDYFKKADYDCRDVAYVYRDFDGVEHSVSGNAARQAFFDDCVYLFLDRFTEEPSTGLYRTTTNYQGMFEKWYNEGTIAAFEVPSWSACQ